MSHLDRYRLAAIGLLVVIQVCSAGSVASASLRGLPVLNPKDYCSPSGEFSLKIDPSDKYGRHKASYRVTQNGKVIWSHEFPFTLWEAGITDRGVVAGCAYTQGPTGIGGIEGEFIVAIVDPDGNIRLKETTKRQPSEFIHYYPNPIAEGLILDEANDRLVVRVADPSPGRRVETWWVYRLSAGAEIARLQPRILMANPEPARFIIDAKPVAGTPLTLLHWWRYDDRKERTVGARFTLVDLEAKPVWSLDLVKDYEVPENEAAEDKLRDFISDQGALLRVDERRRFDLYFAADSQRVTFSLKEGPHGNWVVSEVARGPYSISLPKPKPPSIPERPLTFLGQTVLRPPAGQPIHPIRNVWDFVLDGRGRIAFLRAEKKRAQSFVLVDQTGKLLHEIRLPENKEGHADWRGTAWVGGNRFVVTRSESRVEWKEKAWWLDVETGKLKAIPGFDYPEVISIVGSADGGFVVLVRMDDTETLRGFDSSGKHRWMVDQGDGEEAELLFSPDDIAVTNTGQIAVLDNSKNTIQFYDRRGKFLRIVDLEKAWGREPSYPTGIVADASGGFLIRNIDLFEGSPPFVRINSDGTIRGGFQPKYADGGKFATRGGVKVAPNGRLWTSDGHALLRLNESGIVDLVLGRAPQADELGKIAAFTIDGRGLLYAVDRRTGSIHVFDSDGKFLHVCKTKSTDFSKEPSNPPITVTDQGHVYLGLGEFGESAEGRYLHFSADGTRLGIQQLKTGECYFQPSTGNVLALGRGEAYLVNAGGDTIRTISRRPDGNWLDTLDVVSFAPDGSFAIVAKPGGSSTTTSVTVNVYTKRGEPIHTINLPFRTIKSSWSSGYSYGIAYDSRHLVATGGGSVVLFDSSGAPLQAFTPAIRTNERTWLQPYLVNGGRELLIHKYGSSTVQRYEMPKNTKRRQNF